MKSLPLLKSHNRKLISELSNQFDSVKQEMKVYNGINKAMMRVIGNGTTKSTERKQISVLRNTSTNSEPIAGKSWFTLLTAVAKATEIHVPCLAPSTKVEDIVDFLKDVIPDESCTQLNL
ncbi:hypothetical protein HHI36_023811 [Cryptolaemus montrouzieri]|uniref:Uncharacterized protein n=1 Tax=Cryptolaemus montrouzieri TaxID=559131 RepID=A0ABD2PJN1_9CUCU